MKKVIALVVALVVLGAAPAVAHVTVTPGEVAAGSYVKLTFRVPNESPTCLLYTSPSPRDGLLSRMPSSA